MNPIFFVFRNFGPLKITFKCIVILILGSFWLSSCRSHVMPCPSFSHVSKEDAYQVGNAPNIKFDRNGRVKK